jgi:hypothetical protein
LSRGLARTGSRSFNEGESWDDFASRRNVGISVSALRVEFVVNLFSNEF